MDEGARGKPWTEDDHHRFTIAYALGKAFRLSRGLRKQVTQQERSLMADAILEHLKLCGLQLARDPRRAPQLSVPCQVTDAAPLPRPDPTG